MNRKKKQKKKPPKKSSKIKSNNKWTNYKHSVSNFFKGFLKWGLIIAPLFIPGSQFIQPLAIILTQFINEKFYLSINSTDLASRLQERTEKISKKALIDEVFQYLKEKKSDEIDSKKEIEIETALSKLNTTLEKIHTDFQDNPQELNEIYQDLIVEIEEQNKELSKVIKELSSNQQEFLEKFSDSLRNAFDQFQHVLWYYQSKTINNLSNYTLEELLYYCKTQLELEDIASRYDNPFDKEKYISFTDLDTEFEKFLETSIKSIEKRRIFLILGHMGLGKTWTSCHLSQIALNKCKIPTFFFHLGRNFESKFETLFGGIENPIKLKNLCDSISEKTTSKTGILLVLDGFDELTLTERNKTINPMLDLIRKNKNSPYIMILLTSRQIDWMSTAKISELSTTISNYIYIPPLLTKNQETNFITPVSWVLTDIEDDKLLEEICIAYNVDFEKIRDEKIRKLIQKPFILNIIAKKKKKLLYENFTIENHEWFEIFVGKPGSPSILRRMGIIGEIEIFFQNLISFIGDPYNPTLEDNLRPILSDNQYASQVILSSGILYKKRNFLQNEYCFPDEIQNFINLYLLNLKGTFQNNEMCKSDAEALKSIQIELNKGHLINYTGSEDTHYQFGYVLGNHQEVVEFYIVGKNIPYIPPAVFKLIHLEKLVFKQNELRNLSKSIRKLRFLRILDISHNKLNKLPKEIGSLKYIEEISIFNNEIKIFPKSFFQLSTLKKLYFQFNPLEEITSDWKNLKKLEDIQAGKHKEINSNEFALKKVANGIKDKAKILSILKDNNIEKFRLKDGIILDYLSLLKSQRIIQNFFYQINKEFLYVESLRLVLNSNLKFYDLFWELEDCKSLTLENASVKFGKNKVIQKIEFGCRENPCKSVLNIDESIVLLEELKEITIKDYKDIKITDEFRNCPKIKILNIFNIENLQNLQPFLQNPNIHNVLINDNHSLNLIEFPDNYVYILAKSIIKFVSIPSHIEKFIFNCRSYIPTQIMISHPIEILFIKDHIISISEIKSIFQNENSIYGFCSNDSLYSINNKIEINFEKINKIAIHLQNLKNLPDNFDTLKNITSIVFFYNQGRKINAFKDILEMPNNSFYLYSRNLQTLPANFGQYLHLKFLYINLPSLSVIPDSLFKNHKFQTILFTNSNFKNISLDSIINNNCCMIKCNPSANLPLKIKLSKNTENISFYKFKSSKIPQITGNFSNLQKIAITILNQFELPEWMKDHLEIPCYIKISSIVQNLENPSSISFEQYFQINFEIRYIRYITIHIFPFQNMVIELEKISNIKFDIQGSSPIKSLTLINMPFKTIKNIVQNHLPNQKLMIIKANLEIFRFILNELSNNWRIFLSYSINNIFNEIFNEKNSSTLVVYFILESRLEINHLENLLKDKRYVIFNNIKDITGLSNLNKINDIFLKQIDEKEEIMTYMKEKNPNYYLVLK